MTSQRPFVPGTLRFGAAAALIQSACALVYAISLIVKDLTSDVSAEVVSDSWAAQWIGTGTAIFVILVFGTMAAAAASIFRGRVWGRGLIVLVQFILLPIAWSMISGGLVLFGIATAASAVIALVGILHPRSMHFDEVAYRS